VCRSYLPELVMFDSIGPESERPPGFPSSERPSAIRRR
jgi:hypothetical protein